MRKADNLPPSCAVVMKFGNLNFLEPSGPLQACNGTDFVLVNCTRRLGHVDLEDGGDMFLRNVAYQLQGVAVPHHRRTGVCT